MKYRTLSFVSSSALWLSACGAIGPTGVSEIDRDLSGRYDARWMMSADRPEEERQPGIDWFLDCGGVESALRFDVVEGRLTSVWNIDDESREYTTFVDGSGRFRLELPTGSRTSTDSGILHGILSGGGTTPVLQGTLDENGPTDRPARTGGRFRGVGCAYPVRFERIG